MKKIKQILLFLVLVILLMGVVSSAQLQDDSAGSTGNEATKIVEKTSTNFDTIKIRALLT